MKKTQMTKPQRQRIIEIIEFYKSLIGVDKAECDELIEALDLNLNELMQYAREIISEVALSCGYTYDDLVGHSREVDVVYARTLAVSEVYEQVYIKEKGFILENIGELFNRSYTTIIHMTKQIHNMRFTKDEKFAELKRRYDESKQRSAA